MIYIDIALNMILAILVIFIHAYILLGILTFKKEIGPLLFFLFIFLIIILLDLGCYELITTGGIK